MIILISTNERGRSIMLLSEAWDQYWSDKRIEGYSRLTLRNYQFQHGVLLRYLGGILLIESLNVQE